MTVHDRTLIPYQHSDIYSSKQGLSLSPGHCRELPRVVQEIADVIGREQALYLIGQLPTCNVRDSRYPSKSQGSKRVVMYVPKRLKPDHALVRILGWDDAEKLVRVFGGEILCPPMMMSFYRPVRDRAIVRIHHEQRVPVPMLAEWFEMHPERVRQILGVHQVQIPQEARKAANDDDAPPIHKRAANE